MADESVSETALCPRCERPAKPIDLSEFRGVCRGCFKGMCPLAPAIHEKRADYEITEAAAHDRGHPAREDQDDNHHAHPKVEYYDQSQFLDDFDEALELVKKQPRDVRKMNAELLAKLSAY